MIFEDSFLQRYVQVSLLFWCLTLFEGISYWFSLVTILNGVYLIFEIIWLFFTVVVIFYILVHQHPPLALMLPIEYLFYFLMSLGYLLFYLLNTAMMPQTVFMRLTSVLNIVFAFFGILTYVYLYKRSHRRLWT